MVHSRQPSWVALALTALAIVLCLLVIRFLVCMTTIDGAHAETVLHIAAWAGKVVPRLAKHAHIHPPPGCYRPLHGAGSEVRYVCVQPEEEEAQSTRRTLVLCHGSGFSVEQHYADMQCVANALHVDILALEYPGCFARAVPERHVNRAGMLRWTTDYVDEVLAMVQQHRLDWSRVIVVAICIGAIPALRVAVRLGTRLRGLCMFKAWPSLAEGAVDLVGTDKFVPRRLRRDWSLSGVALDHIACDVLAIHGANDRVARLARVEQLLARMSNARSKRLVVLPGKGHLDLHLPDVTDALRAWMV